MQKLLVAAMLTASLLFAPTVNAQAPTEELQATSSLTTFTIPWNGTFSLPLEAHIGCQLALKGAQEKKVVFSVVNPPVWLVQANTDATFDPAACVAAGTTPNTEGEIHATTNMAISVRPNAPGVVGYDLNVTVTINQAGGAGAAPTSKTSEVTVIPFNVTYHAAHTIVPSITFPYKMTKKSVEFDVVVTENANARSMVMFTDVSATAGHVSGFGSIVYEPPATHTFRINYTAPDSAWTEAHVKFHSYSHFLLNGTNQAGGENLAANYDWVFTNGGVPATTTNAGSSTTKASPLAEAPTLALMVLGLAVVASRRRA